MEERHRHILKSLLAKLRDMDVPEVITHIQQEKANLFLEKQLQAIRNAGHNQCDIFIDILQKRGEDAFQCFVRALISSNHQFLADMIFKAEINNKPTELSNAVPCHQMSSSPFELSSSTPSEPPRSSEMQLSTHQSDTGSMISRASSSFDISAKKERWESSFMTDLQAKEILTMVISRRIAMDRNMSMLPASIAIMGQLLVMSSEVDFPLNKDLPKDYDFSPIEEPSSMRLTLLQIGHFTRETFELSHENMDFIYQSLASFRENIELLIAQRQRGSSNIQSDSLKRTRLRVQEIAKKCAEKAESSVHKFEALQKLRDKVVKVSNKIEVEHEKKTTELVTKITEAEENREAEDKSQSLANNTLNATSKELIRQMNIMNGLEYASPEYENIITKNYIQRAATYISGVPSAFGQAAQRVGNAIWSLIMRRKADGAAQDEQDEQDNIYGNTPQMEIHFLWLEVAIDEWDKESKLAEEYRGVISADPKKMAKSAINFFETEVNELILKGAKFEKERLLAEKGKKLSEKLAKYFKEDFNLYAPPPPAPSPGLPLALVPASEPSRPPEIMPLVPVTTVDTTNTSTVIVTGTDDDIGADTGSTIFPSTSVVPTTDTVTTTDSATHTDKATNTTTGTHTSNGTADDIITATGTEPATLLTPVFRIAPSSAPAQPPAPLRASQTLAVGTEKQKLFRTERQKLFRTEWKNLRTLQKSSRELSDCFYKTIGFEKRKDRNSHSAKELNCLERLNSALKRSHSARLHLQKNIVDRLQSEKRAQEEKLKKKRQKLDNVKKELQKLQREKKLHDNVGPYLMKQALNEGLDAISRLTEKWGAVGTFFRGVSTFQESSLMNAIDSFTDAVEKCIESEEANVEAELSLNYNLVKLRTCAFSLEKLAGTYVEVSDALILPQLFRFDRLMRVRENDVKERDRLRDQLDEECTIATDLFNDKLHAINEQFRSKALELINCEQIQ